MSYSQADLFAQDDAERNILPEPRRLAILARLESTLAKLQAAESFPWQDPLDAVHEENRFERDTELLGEEGAQLWVRFDQEMERLHALRGASDDPVSGASH